jgi:inorganic phosphate transporter, PiT family
MMMTLLVLVIVTAVAFDYINGFHDTANAVATVISTGVLPARTAILLAAILNFVGAFASIKVADFISRDIVALRGGAAAAALATHGLDPAAGALLVILAGLLGAIAWNLLTWYFGIPSSSSHALLGGIIGAAWVSLGGEAIHTTGLFKALRGLVLSPLIGLVGAYFVMLGAAWLSARWRPKTARRAFRWLQLLSASGMAFSHGSNDAQKSMGVIALAMVVAGQIAAPADPKASIGIPFWVILACAAAMALGTASGGYRIIRTMGHKIIALQPIHGFAAETTASLVIQGATQLGVPVSTTHVISGAIMGVGASKRFSAVRWGVAGNIVVAWILTIPICAAWGGGLSELFLLLAR